MAPRRTTRKTKEDTEQPAQRPRSSRAAKLREEKSKAPAAKSSKKAAAAATGVKKPVKTKKLPKRKAVTKAKAAMAKRRKEEEAATRTTRKPMVKASPRKVEEGSVESILNQLPLSELHQICQAISVAAATTKRACVEKIVAWCTTQGERHLVQELEKEVLKEAVQVLEGTVTHNNASRLQNSLRKSLAEMGQEAAFNKLSAKLLDLLTKVFDFEEEGNKADKISALMQEISLWGTLEAFGRMKSDWISEVAAMFDIPKSSKGSTKITTTKKILGQAFPHLKEEAEEEEDKRKRGVKEPEEEEAEEGEEPVEKKPIEKGVSQLDLYQYYTKELVEYCKENNLKVSGTKKDISKRILAFLDGDVEGTRAMKPGEAAAKKRKQSGKRKADASSASKKKSKKTK